MKMLRSILLLVAFLVFGSACSSNDQKPLASGYSRIKVQCTGFDFGSNLIEVTDTASGTQQGSTQDLGCIFYDAVYFDVPVPPGNYNVYSNNQLYKQVTFSQAGIQLIVRITSVVPKVSLDI
jgi:hypothetical protein